VYAPVDEEVFAPRLQVSLGKLPSDLQGAYVRNGPNPLWNLPKEDSNWHWFFGDGMVHCLRLHAGNASYSNHFCRTKNFLAEQEMGQPFFKKIAHCESIRGFLSRLALEKIGLVPSAKSGPSNTALVYHSSRLLALCESDQPLEVKILAEGLLESAACHPYQEMWNAHPKVDPVSGQLFWMNYDVTGQSDKFTFGVVSASGEVERCCTGQLPGGKALMIHDCGITEKYAIVIACPILVGIENLSTEGCIWRYDASHGARIGLFEREGEDGELSPQWFEIEPCYIFHIANSWQEGNVVTLVVVRWDSVDMSGSQKKDRTFWSQRALWKYTFNMDTGEVSEGNLSSIAALEFPVVNPCSVGRKCRYVWAVGEKDNEPSFNNVYKFDLAAKKGVASAVSYSFRNVQGTKLSAGEAFFAQRGVAEDDGYLLTFAVDPQGKENSYFFVLEASSLSVLAIVDLPVRVPSGFHGLWVSEGQILAQRQEDEEESQSED